MIAGRLPLVAGACLAAAHVACIAATAAPVVTAPTYKTAKDYLDAIPDPAIRRVIEQGMAANERRKGTLVAALVANKACRFTKAELETMRAR